jgi:hypothetical protein
VDTDSHRFIGTAAIGPLDALGEVLNAAGNRENLQEALAGIREFMDTLNSGEGSLARFIADDTLIRDAEAFVASLRLAAETLERRESLLGRIIYDETRGARVDTIDFDGPMVEDGHITISEKPGIGVEINEEGMRRYAANGVPFFE